MADLIEVGAALAAFFDPVAGRQARPSHDEITSAVRRFDLRAGDPSVGATEPIGKARRIRGVLLWASDHDIAGGDHLIRHLIDLMRGAGRFDPATEAYGGTAAIERLRQALAPLGYELADNGAVRPRVIDNLSGTELTDAIGAVITRINNNPGDPALLVGSGKDLVETAARHVLVERTGSYPQTGRQGSFPVTLTTAYTLLGLTPAPGQWSGYQDADPLRAVQQAVLRLATAANRLRNDAGTGHGRPGQPHHTVALSKADAQLVARATALVAGLLIDRLAQS